jgi:hypothetical protein
VVNPFRLYRIEFAKISAIHPGYGEIIFERFAESPIVAWAVQESNLSQFLSRNTRRT